MYTMNIFHTGNTAVLLAATHPHKKDKTKSNLAAVNGMQLSSTQSTDMFVTISCQVNIYIRV